MKKQENLIENMLSQLRVDLMEFEYLIQYNKKSDRKLMYLLQIRIDTIQGLLDEENIPTYLWDKIENVIDFNIVF